MWWPGALCYHAFQWVTYMALPRWWPVTRAASSRLSAVGCGWDGNSPFRRTSLSFTETEGLKSSVYFPPWCVWPLTGLRPVSLSEQQAGNRVELLEGPKSFLKLPCGLGDLGVAAGLPGAAGLLLGVQWAVLC